LDGAYTPQVGDAFTFVSAAGVRSGSPGFDLPSLGAGLVWETNSFATTGVLYITNEPAGSAGAYAAWLTNYPTLSDTNPEADPDGDGYPNGTEFAFDGNPTVGTPALVKAGLGAAGTVKISFVANNELFAQSAYSVLATTSLTAGFTNSTNVMITNALDQSGVLLSGGYTRKEFEVPAMDRNFFRIKAQLPE
jgi:hypothetical protein